MTDPRLQRLLGGAARQALRQRLRRLLQRGASGPVRLDRLSEDDQATLAAMLGRPARPASSMLVDLDAVDAALSRVGIAGSLRDALERLDGPMVDHEAERARLAQRWEAVFAMAGAPALEALLAQEGGRRLLRRLARLDAETGEHLGRQASAVLARLPAAGVPRSLLAASVLGDAHGLDDGRPVATLVLAAWRNRSTASLGEAPMTDDSAMDDSASGDRLAPEADAPPERNRDVWADAGVLVNALARPALVLNLPPLHDGRELFAAGEPGFLSLRHLLGTPPVWRLDGTPVHVCENPNIVAWAADRLGERSAPLVCTDGMPAAAQRVLLMALELAGARLRYHGDFDWPGLRIANAMVGHFKAEPWRMSSDDYRLGLARGGEYAHPLRGEPVEADWDEGLAAAMRVAGVALAEEAVAGDLLADLAGDCQPTR